MSTKSRLLIWLRVNSTSVTGEVAWVTVKDAVAIAGQVSADAGGVEGAACARPDPSACRSGVDVDDPNLAGDGSGPDGVGAEVEYLEGSGMGEGEESEVEDESVGGRRSHRNYLNQVDERTRNLKIITGTA